MSKYVKYKHLLKDGDIILTYRAKNLLHKIICYFTKNESKYKAGHAELYLFENLFIEANGKGVKIKKLPNYKKNKYKLYIIRYKKLTKNQMHKIIKSSMIHSGKKYSFLQVLMYLFKYAFKLKRVRDVSRKMFVCSELVDAIYKEAGIELFPGISSVNVSPMMYFNIPNTKMIEVINN